MSKNKLTTSEIENIINIYVNRNSVKDTSTITRKNVSTVKKYLNLHNKMRTRSESASIRPQRVLSELHKSRIGLSNKDKIRSVETIEKLSMAKKERYGETSNNWKGGITPLNNLIRHSSKNKEWIKEVFERDDYTCQECGQVGGNLNAHHKILFSSLIKKNNVRNINDSIKCEVLWNIDNGVTLCEKCHRCEHKR